MPRALILTEAPASPEPLRLGLLAGGYNVLDEITEPQRLLKRASAIEPDIVVIATDTPSPALFEALRVLYDNAPCAVAVYTTDTSEASIEQAAACGVQAWETGGLSGERLPAQLAAARARFRLLNDTREALEEASSKLEERKLVDRAKGILMQSKRMSENEAYSALRKLAMEKKLKMGAIAEQIINTAHLLA
ncbi:MAG: response regulator receiver and domain protein [Betaproteobacteria bacterium]|nr:response regulator receiver and domain protein [Betaproteobacteria bacterium]